MNEEHEAGYEAQKSADISERPAISRNATNAIGRGDVREKCVVEHRRTFEADVRYHEPDQGLHGLTGQNAVEHDTADDTNGSRN